MPLERVGVDAGLAEPCHLGECGTDPADDPHLPHGPLSCVQGVRGHGVMVSEWVGRNFVETEDNLHTQEQAETEGDPPPTREPQTLMGTSWLVV
jgi:hypothetical protein